MNSDILIITAMVAGSAVLAGVVAYLLGRDLPLAGRIAGALAAAVVVGGASLFVPYLPAAAVVVATAAHLLARRLLKPVAALGASAAVLVGGVATGVAVMTTALGTM